MLTSIASKKIIKRDKKKIAKNYQKLLKKLKSCQ